MSSQPDDPSRCCAPTPSCISKCLLRENLVKTGIKSTCFRPPRLLICLFACTVSVWCLRSCPLTASCFHSTCGIVSICMCFHTLQGVGLSGPLYLSCLFFSSSVLHRCCVLFIFVYRGGILRAFGAFLQLSNWSKIQKSHLKNLQNLIQKVKLSYSR